MSDDTSNPDNRTLSNYAKTTEGRPTTVFLRARPESFFSNKFKLELGEVYTDEGFKQETTKSEKITKHLMNANLVLMIIFIGIPVLLYCVFTSIK